MPKTGSTWSPAGAGITNNDVNALLTVGSVLLAGTSGGIFRSTDGGLHWSSSSSGLTVPFVNALASGAGTIFAGTYGGGICRSADGGVNWVPAPGSIPPYGADVNAIVTSGTSLFTGTPLGGLYVSRDSARTWSVAGLTDTCVTSLVASGTSVFAGTLGAGVMLSNDGGVSWTGTGLPSTDVLALAINGTFVVAGTSGHGVWRRPMSQMTVMGVAASSGSGPAVFRLGQNFPNPFNPSTTIAYQVPAAGRVTLRVFDLLGRELSTLVDERKDAGSYAVRFEGANLASGVYLYRLTAGQFTQTRKMVIMK
jgi:hypothetical protein